MEEKVALLQVYSSLKANKDMLEDKIDELKPQIMAIIDEANPDEHEVQTEFGTFVNVQKRVYTYSDEVKKMEERVKEMKTEEEARGTAPYEIKPYMKFTSKNVI